MATLKTLEEALKEIVRDEHKVSKFDAQVIKELILADGKISREEQVFLERALEQNVLDESAYEILSQLLMRSQS